MYDIDLKTVKSIVTILFCEIVQKDMLLKKMRKPQSLSNTCIGKLVKRRGWCHHWNQTEEHIRNTHDRKDVTERTNGYTIITNTSTCTYKNISQI